MDINISKLLLLLALLLAFSSSVNAADNGFDQICQISTQVLTAPSNKSLPQGKKLVLIYEKIHKSITSQTVLNAYEAYVLAEANTRYSMLKKIAEQELKHSWACPIIKNFNF